MKQVIRNTVKDKYGLTDEPTIYTLLLDMNSIMKMSLVDKRINSDGKEYGMVYQTLLQIKKQLDKKDFNFVYAFYDGDNSGQLRYDFYKEYKLNRDKHYEDNNKSEYDKSIDNYCKKVIEYHKKKKYGVELKRSETEDESFERQRGIVFACLEELFCRNLMCDLVEGDDLIAFYVKNKKPNEKIVIVSGDRDLTQLIADDVCIYITQLKKYITPQNHIENIGYTHENVLIKKILCGDSSDNIKGIKGMGEKTFFELFPDAKTKKLTLDDIMVKTKEIIEERAKNKKKPLVVTENIINKVTLGPQGKNIYEINDKLINLSNPLLTEEARDELSSMMHAPLDPEGRDLSNLYRIINENGITELITEDKFSDFFSSFYKLIDNEKKYLKKVNE